LRAAEHPTRLETKAQVIVTGANFRAGESGTRKCDSS
jgi:hypothetical protein